MFSDLVLSRSRSTGRGIFRSRGYVLGWLLGPSAALLLQPQLAWGACSAKAAKDVVIVLDVGHIAKNPAVRCSRETPCYYGSTSARGVPEYDFNLKLARRIGEELVSEGFLSTHVMVTRTV